MKRGLRHVAVSLELMGEILRGQRRPCEAIDVPADLEVYGSVAEASKGTRTVVLLCGSDEWDGVTDETGAMLTFNPTYRSL